MAVIHCFHRVAPPRRRVGIGRGLPLLRRLASCRDGATLVEFAFALPLVLMIFLGMFEVAMVMFVSTSVEGGLREAARYGITGQGSDAAAREAAILGIIEDHTFGFIDLDEAEVTFMVYDSFSNVGQPEPWDDDDGDGVWDADESYTDVNGNGQWDEDQGTAGLGDAGAVVRYTIAYDWILLTPYLAALLGDEGVFHMSASITVRNEPFSFASSGEAGES